VKVLMVTPSYDPIVGGTEAVVKNLARVLNQRGIRTDVMTFNMDKKWHALRHWEVKRDGEATLYRVPGYGGAFTRHLNCFGINLHFVPSLKFIKFANQYDIVHFHDVIDLSFPLFSFFIKKPKVFHCHTLSESIKIYQYSIINRYLLRRAADYFICIGNLTKHLLVNLGVKQSKVFNLPNAVNVTTFKSGKRKRENNVILFVGRITRRKGLHVLLRSLSYLKTPVQLIIIGGVSDEKYFKEIQGLISSLKESQHFITYLGSASTHELIHWYQSGTIFICPSLKEEFGIVNIEAMACQMPVIATRVGNIPDIIDHMQNGILVSPGDPIELADAINYLLENEQERIGFGDKARKKVIKYFSWDVIADKLCGVYQSIIKTTNNR